MTRMRTFFLGCVAAASLAACVNPPTPEEQATLLKKATAEALPGTDAATVTVSGIESQATKIAWRAEVAGKAYRCDADELYHLPSCHAAT